VLAVQYLLGTGVGEVLCVGGGADRSLAAVVVKRSGGHS
jgi:hypothetical protein